jgi:hypothetical protein
MPKINDINIRITEFDMDDLTAMQYGGSGHVLKLAVVEVQGAEIGYICAPKASYYARAWNTVYTAHHCRETVGDDAIAYMDMDFATYRAALGHLMASAVRWWQTQNDENQGDAS